MNLGEIYLKSALVIIGLGFVLGFFSTFVFLLVRRKRLRISSLILGTLILGLPLSCIGLAAGQTPLFRVWHRSQNEAVPKEGCLTYEPLFFALHATYQMDRPTFDAWVASHPWKLSPCKPEEIMDSHVSKYFGITTCDAAYQSPRGPKGNNLQVYYRDGIVYLVYSAM